MFTITVTSAGTTTEGVKKYRVELYLNGNLKSVTITYKMHTVVEMIEQYWKLI
jgi:hypothetical protein